MDPTEKPASTVDERRARERSASYSNLRVRLETLAFEGVSDNLSEAGVYFTSSERLRVTVELEGSEGWRVLSGRLVRVQGMSPDSTGYAIEFDRG